jgi:vacuolar-type H+-ATPase subunit I/STV1
MSLVNLQDRMAQIKSDTLQVSDMKNDIDQLKAKLQYTLAEQAKVYDKLKSYDDFVKNTKESTENTLKSMDVKIDVKTDNLSNALKKDCENIKSELIDMMRKNLEEIMVYLIDLQQEFIMHKNKCAHNQQQDTQSEHTFITKDDVLQANLEEDTPRLRMRQTFDPAKISGQSPPLTSARLNARAIAPKPKLNIPKK